MSKNFCSVSVIIPCYKSGIFLRRAVESVINQTYKPTEIIIVDDASDDSGLTLNCIKNIKKDYFDTGILIISLFLKKNSGPSRARNQGWNISTNDYIAFLDSDDAWHPRKLELQYNWMKLNNKFDVTSHSSVIFKALTNHQINKFYAKPLLIKDMLFKNIIHTRTVMLKRKLKERFDEQIRYGEDYDLWMRMMTNSVTFGYSNQKLAFIYRDGLNNIRLSSNLIDMEKSELNVLYNQYQFGNINLLIFLMIYIWSSLKFIRRYIISLFRNLFFF